MKQIIVKKKGIAENVVLKLAKKIRSTKNSNWFRNWF